MTTCPHVQRLTTIALNYGWALRDFDTAPLRHDGRDVDAATFTAVLPDGRWLRWSIAFACERGADEWYPLTDEHGRSVFAEIVDERDPWASFIFRGHAVEELETWLRLGAREWFAYVAHELPPRRTFAARLREAVLAGTFDGHWPTPHVVPFIGGS